MRLPKQKPTLSQQVLSISACSNSAKINRRSAFEVSSLWKVLWATARPSVLQRSNLMTHIQQDSRYNSTGWWRYFLILLWFKLLVCTAAFYPPSPDPLTPATAPTLYLMKPTFKKKKKTTTQITTDFWAGFNQRTLSELSVLMLKKRKQLCLFVFPLTSHELGRLRWTNLEL